jgi:hypothetical protein
MQQLTAWMAHPVKPSQGDQMKSAGQRESQLATNPGPLDPLTGHFRGRAKSYRHATYVWKGGNFAIDQTRRVIEDD